MSPTHLGERTEWKWRRMRGWPDAVPFDVALAWRAVRASGELEIERQLDRRFAGARIGRIRTNPPLVGVAVGLTPFWFILPPAYVLLLSTAVVLPIAVYLLLQGRRRVTIPRWRAVLRGFGIDVCVRCGHAIMGDADTATCPECGFGHGRLPLGWIDEADRDEDWSSARPGEDERAGS